MSKFISADVNSSGVAIISTGLTVVDAHVLVSGSVGIKDSSDEGTIRVFGTVFGDKGVVMGENSTTNLGSVLVIEHGGSVMAGVTAVDFNSHDGLIENHGEIFSSFLAVSFGGQGPGQSTLINTGTIRGGTTGIFIGGGATEDIVITNSGVISGDATGFRAFTGSISGDVTIINTGQMLGDVDFGTGNDIYKGAAGIVSGTISGNFGNDVIACGAGNNRISGDNGVDRLSGGANNDVFIFSALSDGGDRISDFSNRSGNNDGFEMDASGFGGGLDAGSLDGSQFRARADNLAQDANDRFIFRTGDETLWFDADGKGGLEAQLIADLQNNATVAARDIVLF